MPVTIGDNERATWSAHSSDYRDALHGLVAGGEALRHNSASALLAKDYPSELAGHVHYSFVITSRRVKLNERVGRDARTGTVNGGR